MTLHVDVEDVGAAAHLVERDLDGLGVVARLHELREALGAGDIRPLADHDEVRIGPDDEGLEAGEPGVGGELRGLARSYPLEALRDGADVIGRRPAAAADDVDEALGGEVAHEARGDLRRLVVLAEDVRKARVGVAVHERVADAGELLDVRPHLVGAEAAVDPDG
jgi:hypothetical protein